MSLSTCHRCGGHIPLGPHASNVCESCGAGVFDKVTAGPSPSPQSLRELADQMQATRGNLDSPTEEQIAGLRAAADALALHLHAEQVLADHGIELWQKEDGKTLDGFGFTKFKPYVKACEERDAALAQVVAMTGLLKRWHDGWRCGHGQDCTSACYDADRDTCKALELEPTDWATSVTKEPQP